MNLSKDSRYRGGSRIIKWGMDDTNRPPNYTLIYFKLSYDCPKTWRFRKDEGWFLRPMYFCLFFLVYIIFFGGLF